MQLLTSLYLYIVTNVFLSSKFQQYTIIVESYVTTAIK